MDNTISKTMRQLREVWLQAVYARVNAEGKWPWLLILGIIPAIGLLLSTVLYFFARKPFGPSILLVGFLFSLAVAVAIAAVLWLMFLAYFISFQFSPANANLIPQFRKLLFKALAIPSYTFSLIAASVFLFIEPRLALWVLCLALFASFSIVLTVRTQWSIIGLVLSVQIPALISHLPSALAYLRSVSLLYAAFFSVLMLCLAHLSVAWVFAARGDGLLLRYESRRKMRSQFISGKCQTGTASAGLFFSPFALWMRSCVARALKNPSLAPPLSIFALGPRLHWVTTASQNFLIVLSALFVFAIGYAIFFRSGNDFFLGMMGGIGGISLMLPMIYCMTLFPSLFQTRVEQGLIMLTAKAESPQIFESRMRFFLLRQFFILFALSAIAAAVGYFLMAGEVSVHRMIVSSIVAWMPLGVMLCGRFSGIGSARNMKAVFWTMLGSLVFILAIGLQFWNEAFAVFFNLAIVMASVALMWRAHRKNSRVLNFPVGRGA